MKLPKLKYFYLALSAEEYGQFELTRRIDCSHTVQFDLLTNQVQGRTHVILVGSAVGADTEYRQRTHSRLPVFVLRIAADLVDRTQLTAVPDHILVYRSTQSLHIPHCGVERIEIEWV